MSHAGFSRGALAVITAVIAATCLLLIGGAPDASAKGKKVRACVIKAGPDKGLMRFSPKGKCHKGEKKVAWNKKGKKGKRGPAGPAGAQGPQGSSGVTDELLATIATQQATIDQLKSQLDTVTAQLGVLSPQVAALCAQMDAVTDQSNALGTAVGGITVNNALALLGGALNLPALPAALAPFTCPG